MLLFLNHTINCLSCRNIPPHHECFVILQCMCSSKGTCTSKLCSGFTTSCRGGQGTHEHKNKQQLQRISTSPPHQHPALREHRSRCSLQVRPQHLSNFIEAGRGGGFEDNIVLGVEESGGEKHVDLLKEELPPLRHIFDCAFILVWVMNDGKEGWECRWCNKVFAPKHASRSLCHVLKIW